jgi:hypothetical protein
MKRSRAAEAVTAQQFVGADGRQWQVIDFKLGPLPKQAKKRVAIGHPDAVGRAFHRPDETRVYWFGAVSYRDVELRTLRNEFTYAKPITLPAARHHWDR